MQCSIISFEGPFGTMLLAESAVGLAWLGFPGAAADPLAPLRGDLPAADLRPGEGPLGPAVIDFFLTGRRPDRPWPTDLRATDFQRRVWRELLAIPTSRTIAYGDLARRIGSPGATQAVGTAVGRNPLTFLVPCHRVARRGGRAGGYRWGVDRKREICAWEVTS